MTIPINIPNQLTLARLGLAVVFFALLSVFSASDFPANRVLLQWSFWIFLAAVATDILDGYLARSLKQVTSFGRIVDPFVDKVLICGAYIMLAGDRFHAIDTQTNIAGVASWMAVVILSRELLVTTLRAHSERQGVDFSADWAGKIKMIVQSVAIGFVLGTLAFPVFDGLRSFAHFLVWTSVVVTALSIITYMNRAREFLFSEKALTHKPTTPSPEETQP